MCCVWFSAVAVGGEAFVEGLEVGEGAGFDDVGAEALAVVGAAGAVDLDGDFAHGVFAAGDAADVVLSQGRFDADDAFEAAEGGVDGAVAGRGVLARVAVFVGESDRGGRDRAHACEDVKLGHRPRGRGLV